MNDNEMQSILRQAIDRSRSYDEIVHVEIDTNDIDAVLAELASIYDGDIDSVALDDGSADIWIWQYDGPADTSDWRLRVKLDTTERDAWKWARDEQGYTGALADWLKMPADKRAEYEAGAEGIGTV